MANENDENIDSSNDAEDTSSEEAGESDSSEGSEEITALNERIQKIEDSNKQLFERAKKAEGELKGLRKESKEEPEAKEEINQPNEPDYGRLAFLQSKGIDHPDDIKTVQDEADRLKLPLTDVLGMKHIQANLQESKETREAQSGMPKGSKRSGGTTQHDVEYHIAKGTTPDSQELAEKVVEARMKKESQNKFSDSLYTG